MDASVYGLSWYAANAVARDPAPQLAQDIDTDVCVVGGGLAGLTTALEIARRGWPVVLLEGRRIAWSASGRNTGFVLPGFAQDPAVIADRVGIDHARTLWALSEQGVDYVRRAIAEHRMEGVDPTDGWLNVSKIDRAAEMAADAELMRDAFGANVEFLDADRVRARLKSERYFQAIHYPTAFHINPLNYAFGLARAAENAGARIYEETPVLHIDPEGVRKRVVTPQGRVRAAHVVLAGNVHLGSLMPDISGTLLPITTYVIATKPLGDALAEAMAYRGAVSDSDWADNHYRPTADNRLIWSGRMSTRPKNPKRFVNALRRDIARTYPQLGKVDVEFAWSGTLGSPLHRMPNVGELSPGLWVASGFSGHGLNTTAIAGVLLARAITEGDRAWTAFNPFELIWAGGRAGLAFARGRYLAHRAHAAIAGYLSRRRDIAQRARLAEEAAPEQTAQALDVPIASKKRGKAR